MTKYSNQIVKHICDLVESDSYTIVEICGIVGISKETYYKWISTHSDFSDSIKKAKSKFDEMIVSEAKRSLVKLIKGYDVDEKKTVYSNDKEGRPKVKEQTTVKKHIQPSVSAVIFLLTNKSPDEYKNRHSGQVEPPEQDETKTAKMKLPDGTEIEL